MCMVRLPILLDIFPFDRLLTPPIMGQLCLRFGRLCLVYSCRLPLQCVHSLRTVPRLVVVTFPDRTRIEQFLIMLVTTRTRPLLHGESPLNGPLMCMIRGRPMASALAPLKKTRDMWFRPLSILRVPTRTFVPVR